MKEGSFDWYSTMSGGFVRRLANAILSSDRINREKIRLVYPQMVAAEEHNWSEPPPGFEPKYDGNLLDEEVVEKEKSTHPKGDTFFQTMNK